MDWNAMAAPWLRVEAETDAAHGPVLERVLSRADLRAGHAVLDIGPGAGVSLVALAEAVGPSGHVTGVEIAPPFAARARERVPAHVALIEADAESHPFAPAQFDRAVSLFGVMFFTDSVAAFSNIRTALKPGGQFCFACWGPPAANPWFSVPARVAAGVFGPGEVSDPMAPGPMRFADPAALHALLERAGWAPKVETVDLSLTPRGGIEGAADLMMTIGSAASRMGEAKEAGTLRDEHRVALRAGLIDAFGALPGGALGTVPAQIHFVTATA